ALSEFRHAKLIDQLRQSVPTIESLTADFVYFIDTPHALDEQTRQRLNELLDAREQRRTRDGALYLVVPRLGTLSPWSTK
ncbi:hypothetical protein C0075_24655, partial [Rhizobium sp. KAs_5_22]